MITDQIFHRALRLPYKLHTASDVRPELEITVVFIHGIGSSAGMWDHIIPKISSQARIITLDLLGFGRSPKPEWSKYDARQHAIALARTLREHKVKKDKVIVVGHSLGALVAIEYAYRYKKRVASLILCSPPFYQPAAKKTTRIIPRDDAYRKLYEYVRHNPSKLLKIGELANQYFILNKGMNINDSTVPAYIKSLEASIENQNSAKRVQKITAPTAIIYGRLDLLLIKRNLKQVAEENENVTLHSVTATHEITGLFSKKVILLTNRSVAKLDK